MNPLEATRRQLENRLTLTSQEEVGVRQSTRWMRSVTWSLIATTGFAITWLALAKTEEIVVATGKLEPIGAVKEIQMPVGGVARMILVKEGQRVKAGQILMQLDTESSGQRGLSLNKSMALKQSELLFKQEELKRYLELNAAQSRQLSKQLDLDRTILGRMEQLNAAGAMAELQFLNQRNKVQESIGKLEQSRTDRLRQMAILEQQLENLRSQVSELRAQQADSNLTLRYQSIRSPVDGVVFDLKPTNAGYVAQTSTPVMKVVPNAKLQAKVEIASSDIGFVKQGMPVDLSVDSFPASDFGVLEGKVKRIGSDALPPDQAVQRTDYRFPAEISLLTQELTVKNGQTLPLQVGMSVQAHIKLRKVTYLQLLLESFKDKTDSLRRI
ncbi:HlyD family efflux transporter periplasmic adaptor subunit [Synechococcus sp. GreenBA-s]|nr:HlyD family efflux transporter periplasmic adaptor subunit [Synechococcus sp. GreenBA-s]